MTEDNAKPKLTLSGKSTLTLKVGANKASSGDKKMVQVEVRKKRIINAPTNKEEPQKTLDKETAAKLKLLAEAKEYDIKRKADEQERSLQRKRIAEEEAKEKAKEKARIEAENKARELKEQENENKAKEEESKSQPAHNENKAVSIKSDGEVESRVLNKFKDRQKYKFDDDDDDDDDNTSASNKPVSKEEVFEQERKKQITKRSFEPQRRNTKVNIHNIRTDDDDDDYGYGGVHRRFKKKAPKPVEVAAPAEKVIKDVIIPEVITVQELANRMAEKSADVIKKLMSLGVMATINQAIDADTAQIIVEEFGHKYKRVADSDVEQGLHDIKDTAEQLLPRAPVVTVMGHVDHGKTSLLDALRETNVVAKEAGGITQHIGAYQITVKSGQKITFIDTPGHEAFSEMRARGAKVTDIVVLVVAANDGIMPQTIEAIRHAQAAEVPIVVAINKIDLPGADPMKVKTALLQHGIGVEDMGGECLCAEVSAKKRINIDKLVEAILLQAEMLDLKANPNRASEGAVIEAKMEKGRGTVVTALVQKGTLHVGDICIAGKEWGNISAMFN